MINCKDKTDSEIMNEFLKSIIFEDPDSIEEENEHPDEFDDEYDDYDEIDSEEEEI